MSSSKTYSQMLVEAQTIHPEAQIRVNDGSWEIFIPTTIYASNPLPDSFNGTPAAHALLSSHSNGKTKLKVWAERHKYENKDLVDIAHLFNLSSRRFEWVNDKLNKIMVAKGYPTDINDIWKKDSDIADFWLTQQRKLIQESLTVFEKEIKQLEG